MALSGERLIDRPDDVLFRFSLSASRMALFPLCFKSCQQPLYNGVPSFVVKPVRLGV